MKTECVISGTTGGLMDPNYCYKISWSLTRVITKLPDRRINLRFFSCRLHISLLYSISNPSNLSSNREKAQQGVKVPHALFNELLSIMRKWLRGRHQIIAHSQNWFMAVWAFSENLQILCRLKIPLYCQNSQKKSNQSLKGLKTWHKLLPVFWLPFCRIFLSGPQVCCIYCT